MDEYNIMLAGVGGTGVLTAAVILGEAAVKQGENVRVGEIHGMAQRGGVINCTVRIGDKIYGPTIPDGKGHLLLAFELVEGLRAINSVSPQGVAILSTYRIVPVMVSLGKATYPSKEEIISDVKKFVSKVITIDCLKIAEKAGNPLTMNVAMLGVASGAGYIPLKQEILRETIEELVPKKYVDVNLKAFDLGVEEGRKTSEE